MPANVWILNLVVLGAVLEADLGRRKIGWIRVLRPLLTAVLICPLFLDSIPTDSHDLALQAAGIGAGVLLGLVAHLFISVGYGSVKGRRGTRDRAVSRTGFGYGAFWTVVYGGRLLFIYGTLHWFSVPLLQFMAAHQLSVAGLTDALIFMAVAMALTRSALLGVRGRAAARRFAAGTGASATAGESVRELAQSS
jgi:hypothetical protein